MSALSIESLSRSVRERGRDRSRVLRGAILLWMVFAFSRHLRNPYHDSILGGLNLAFHEIGHILFLPFPEMWTVAGGTLLELAIPVVVGVLLYRQREDFGIAFALFWLATALFGAAVYAADARAQLLPLVSPMTGVPEHDWTILLGEFGLLERDREIGRIFRGLGVLSMGASIVVGGVIMRLLATDPERRSEKPASRVSIKPEALAAEEARFRAWMSKQPPVPGLTTEPAPQAEPAARAEWAEPAAEAEPAARAEPPAPAEPTPRAEPADLSPRRAIEPLTEAAREGKLSAEEIRFLEFLKKSEEKK